MSAVRQGLQRVGTWVTDTRAVLVAVVGAIGLAAIGMAIDSRSTIVNLLTEGSGIALGTVLTVFFIERRRRLREVEETDARWRNRLRDELSRNVSMMLQRNGATAIAPHQLLRRDLFVVISSS